MRVAKNAITPNIMPFVAISMQHVGAMPKHKKRAPANRGSVHSMAGYAGLEPATSDVTGRRSNQLS
jgi:hypothetical protein